MHGGLRARETAANYTLAGLRRGVTFRDQEKEFPPIRKVFKNAQDMCTGGGEGGGESQKCEMRDRQSAFTSSRMRSAGIRLEFALIQSKPPLLPAQSR